ncbi:UNKNOWN [Stylonychia lemnae]|uniref:Uncharacterized protein n=1 Tax=Stylonychia lemnae TaxID=5949 RepID=A0A078AFR9_STYLE|nr:UNKNOWN [Stylonychia lemnae]|eukprot:CDW80686.1 UNKNOWN [Stylonychia lemnae]
MSLYKAPETTQYFKILSQKEQANPPHLRPSREARVLSKKYDMLCINDVVQIHDVQENYKNKMLLEDLDQTQNKQKSKGLHQKQIQQIKKNFDRQMEDYEGDIISKDMQKDLSHLLKDDIQRFIKNNKLKKLQMECSKVKELLGQQKKETLFQHRKPLTTMNKVAELDKSYDMRDIRRSLDIKDEFKVVDIDTQGRPMTISNKKKNYLRRSKKVLMDSTFHSISRDKRDQVFSNKTNAPPIGLYKLNFSIIEPNNTSLQFGLAEIKQRFDYSKPETMLWIAEKEQLESKDNNQSPRCVKCIKKQVETLSTLQNNNSLGSVIKCEHSLTKLFQKQKQSEKIIELTRNDSPLNKTKDNFTRSSIINLNVSLSPTKESFKKLNGQGVMSFATQTSRKPITEGQLNPNDERFTLEASKYPQIYSKEKHSPIIQLSKYSRRNSNQFKTNFTGFLHYQPDIPAFYPVPSGSFKKEKSKSPQQNTFYSNKLEHSHEFYNTRTLIIQDEQNEKKQRRMIKIRNNEFVEQGKKHLFKEIESQIMKINQGNNNRNDSQINKLQ